MATRELSVCWETATHRCVLYRVDGVLELRLHDGDRVASLATCVDLERAAAVANLWRGQFAKDAVDAASGGGAFETES